MLRCFARASLLLVLAGCVTPTAPLPRLVSFNEEEYRPYAAAGTSVIYGEAFLKTQAGDVKKGAGNKIHLNPVTQYSTEWYERAVLAGIPLEPADPRVFHYHREMIADSEGRFRFEKLPAGEYYAICEITWAYVQGNALLPTGGVAHAKIRVGPGEEVKAILIR